RRRRGLGRARSSVHAGLAATAMARGDPAGADGPDARILPGPRHGPGLVLDYAGLGSRAGVVALDFPWATVLRESLRLLQRGLRLDRRCDFADALALLERRGAAQIGRASCREG